MEFTDNGIKLTGEEAQVLGGIVELGCVSSAFPTTEAIDRQQLDRIIRPFACDRPFVYDEAHDVEISRADFPTVLEASSAVLANLDVAVDELSRDATGDRMPMNPQALRDLATVAMISNAMAGVLYQEKRERLMQRYRQRERS